MTVAQVRSTSLWRWPVLLLSSLVLTGSYYCLDIPAALKAQLDTYFGYPQGYETLFSMLYSLYATPNVILPFFGGYFVDRYGVSNCLLVFSALLAIGQSVVVAGLFFKSWYIIFLGRFIFGLGGDSSFNDMI
jgi:MFS family permease